MNRVFRDDFTNGLGNWYTWSGHPGGEPQDNWDAKHVTIGKGVLNLVSTVDHTSGGVGMKQTFTYGTFRWRSRRDRGDGISCIALSWPEDNVWPAHGEIDWIEDDPTGIPNSFATTVHYAGADGSNQFVQNHVAGLDLTKWHVWEAVWSAGKITLSCDGKQVVKQIGTHVPTTPMRLDFQAEWVGPAVPTKTSRFQIDWVEVWQ